MNEELKPAKRRSGNMRDLTGRRFGRLVALRPTGERAADGCYYWLCRCDCGNMSAVRSNKLLQGYTQSCGCYKKERLKNSKTYNYGTCLEIVNSDTIPKNNTSGVKGVSPSRNGWTVQLSLARKIFFLGRYDDFNIACEVIEEAERIRRSVTEELDVLGTRATDVLTERFAQLRKEYRPYLHTGVKGSKV